MVKEKEPPFPDLATLGEDVESWQRALVWVCDQALEGWGAYWGMLDQEFGSSLNSDEDKILDHIEAIKELAERQPKTKL